ncbi:hypothetical protein NZ698_01275 [Chryseobacterium sp. PBS4-4]|uniref:Ig-like domain-containing protein n=1 Tax=Chryseobacterium edaphi TaxID=2976532 RepID=A0ABT2W508_9FLAO|nr:hypothetical protein [Chryseobacterium edaphi]MCU7615815.1 hypothetical protein [Chryseobacterium edaphi]
MIRNIKITKTKNQSFGLLKTILTFCLLLVLVQINAQTKYFVTQNGNNANNGLTWETAKGPSFINDLYTIYGVAGVPANTKIYVMGSATTYNYSQAVGFLTNGTGFEINGGYAPSSTGTDISKYNPKLYPTTIYLTGASSGMLSPLNNNETAAFKGIRFRGNNAVIFSPMVYRGTIGSSAMSLSFTDCEFFAFGDTVSGSGAQPIWTQDMGMYSFENCYFHDNGAANDGAAFSIVAQANTVLKVNNCVFTNNVSSSGQQGGGGAIATGARTNTITNSSFCENKMTTGAGGAIGTGANAGGAGAVDLTISGCTFNDNRAAGYFGGAINLNGGIGSTLSISDSKFYNNKETSCCWGGGAIAFNKGTTTTTLITRCDFYGNSAAPTTSPTSASGEGGGAILIRNNTAAGNVTISYCVFDNNSVPANSYGGAIYYSNSFSGGNIAIDNCTFVNNKIGTSSVAAGSDVGLYTGQLNTYGQYTITNSKMQLSSDAAYVPYVLNTVDRYIMDATNSYNNASGSLTTTSFTCPNSINTICLASDDSNPVLTATTLTNVCPSATANLTSITATNQNSDVTLTWHTGSTPTNANKIANPSAINQTGIYYAAFYDAVGGCYSAGTTPVTVSISKCTTVTNICPATTVNLTTLVAASSNPNIEVTWHTGTPATDANKVANPAAVGAGTYYASFHDIAGGCYSITTGAVTVVINVCPTCAASDDPNPVLTATTLTNVCPSATANLTSITATNQNSDVTLTWHTGSVPTDANKIANPAAINQGGTYYAAFYDSVFGCYSLGSTPVTVTISKCTTVTNTCPSTTVNLTTLVAASSDPNIEITWHTGTPATDANKVANPSAVSVSGTYYASFHDIAGGCYSPTTGAITVVITDCVTPFPCDNSAYLTKGMNANVQLFKHNLLTGVTDATPLVSFNTLANGLAYNPINNTLWILVTPAPTATSKAKLTRIDAAGVVTTFDVPNLPAALGSNPTSGAITSTGYYVAKVSASPLAAPGGGANANDGDNYVVIDVNPSRATYLQVIDPANGYAVATAPYYKETVGNVLINVADFAYNNADGLLYGMDLTGKLVSLNIATGAYTTGNTVVLPDGTPANASAYVASYIDATGSLYSINVNTGVTYRVKIPSGKAILMPSATAIANMDGANCPTAVFAYAVQGNVFDDTNALTDGIVNGTPTNLTNSLNAILYNNTTGAVAAVNPVAANGTYAFGVIPGNSYTIYITTNTATVGQTAVPVVALPLGWVNSGENNCGNTAGCTGSDGTANGILSLGTVSADISQANFGVNQSAQVCYKPGATGGTVLDTQHGITALGRAGIDNDNWPMLRKGAWTVLEAKTKGFVVNRLDNAQVAAIPSGDLREGMMIYNINQDCLQVNTDGTATGWKCFNTQTCPD